MLLERQPGVEWLSTTSTTLLDADTRYLLRAEPMLDPHRQQPRAWLEEAISPPVRRSPRRYPCKLHS